MTVHDVIIVGGGPAGLSAARRLLTSGIRDVVVLERESEAGGIPAIAAMAAASPYLSLPMSGPAMRGASSSPQRRRVRTQRPTSIKSAASTSCIPGRASAGRALHLRRPASGNTGARAWSPVRGPPASPPRAPYSR
jgi:glycine/D-amino acid oxidase-like deaminating enzyme